MPLIKKNSFFPLKIKSYFPRLSTDGKISSRGRAGRTHQPHAWPFRFTFQFGSFSLSDDVTTTQWQRFRDDKGNSQGIMQPNEMALRKQCVSPSMHCPLQKHFLPDTHIWGGDLGRYCVSPVFPGALGPVLSFQERSVYSSPQPCAW